MDPIADALTSIRNAVKKQKRTVNIPFSRLKEKILEIFKREGYIEGYQFIPKQGQSSSANTQGVLRVYLKYEKPAYGKKEKSAIMGLKIVSKPSRRVYVKREKLPYVLQGLGTAIISTSHGVLTDKEARKIGVGGEVICYVW
ncbi:MAG: 30S ribosomal protein S8 [Candidatus Omnitrophota bacterium]|nr:MAG: 30S ribosomal protein S8 [Candidatus Omnitrophota bacterium]